MMFGQSEARPRKIKNGHLAKQSTRSRKTEDSGDSGENSRRVGMPGRRRN